MHVIQFELSRMQHMHQKLLSALSFRNVFEKPWRAGREYSPRHEDYGGAISMEVERPHGGW